MSEPQNKNEESQNKWNKERHCYVNNKPVLCFTPPAMPPKEATTHEVLLKIDPKTYRVDKCPPAQGSAFDTAKTDPLDAFRKTEGVSAQTKGTPKPNYYVYLDVGVWAGSNYNFGLICGQNVWLCDFRLKSPHQPVPSNAWWPSRAEAPEPLRKFDDVFTADGKNGFSVKTYAHVPGNYRPPSDMLYIILPDMHMPGVRTDLPCMANGMPTYQDILQELGLTNAQIIKQVHLHMDPNTRARPATFLLKEDADIFGGAANALLSFLFPLASGDYTSKFKVVQVGDLCELWQGMDRWGTFFAKDASGTLKFDSKVDRISVTVSNGPKSKVYEIFEQKSVDALAHRIQGILLQQWPIFRNFELIRQFGQVEFLYGNHDVYLVDNLRPMNKEWRDILMDLYPCKTHLFESHVSFEHGHRMDEYNQDGDWRGQFITELVFVAPFLRELDPDRREMYHHLSAADVYYHNYFGEPISVFVMGHTHKPDLSYIRFWNRRDKDFEDYESGSICMTCSKKG